MTKEQILELRINEVLYYFWDPIGINDYGPAARDEYDLYADHVWRMALAGKSMMEISAYLTSIRTERMELTDGKDRDDDTAELVIDWKIHLGLFANSHEV